MGQTKELRAQTVYKIVTEWDGMILKELEELLGARTLDARHRKIVPTNKAIITHRYRMSMITLSGLFARGWKLEIGD